MNVVNTNIACQPLKNAGQFPIRAAFDGRKGMTPFVFPLFLGVFVLMLNVKSVEKVEKRVESRPRGHKRQHVLEIAPRFSMVDRQYWHSPHSSFEFVDSQLQFATLQG